MEPIRTIQFVKPKTPDRPIARTPAPPKSRRKKTRPQNLDIFELHDRIMTILEEEFFKLPELKRQAKRLQWIIKNGDTIDEQRLAETKLSSLQHQISFIESGFKEARYLHRTEKILDEYTQLINKPIVVNFMGNCIDDKQDRKKSIISEFLNIAKDYISVTPIESQTKSMVCEDCNIDLQRDDEYFFICPMCGYAVKHLASIASYQENNRINVAQRYVYDKRAHFGDSIKKFQAKQNTSIHTSVYKDLREKCVNHEIPMEKLTKDHVYEFLRITGHSDHYEDIMLIYCELTGKEPPDISHLEQQLFSLFDEIDPVYERVKPADRVNFLNGQFVLFKLLQKLRYPCREEDFYILKTRDKMLEHDALWKKICDELHWTYIATV